LQGGRRSACPMEVISPGERPALLQELNLTPEYPLELRGQAAGSMAHPVSREAR